MDSLAFRSIQKDFLVARSQVKKYVQSWDDEKDLPPCVTLLLSLDSSLSRLEFEALYSAQLRIRTILALKESTSSQDLYSSSAQFFAKAYDRAKSLDTDLSREFTNSVGSNASTTFSDPALLKKVFSKMLLDGEKSGISLRGPTAPLSRKDALEILSHIFELCEDIIRLRLELHALEQELLSADPHSPAIREAKTTFDAQILWEKKRVMSASSEMLRLMTAALHYAQYSRRFSQLAREMQSVYSIDLFNKKFPSLNSFMQNVLKDYTKPHPLFDYSNFTLTMRKESKKLGPIFLEHFSFSELQFQQLMNLLSDLATQVMRGYRQRGNSPYHGIEHTEQITITSIRLFCSFLSNMIREKSQRLLGPREFFICASSALFHDTGYFTDHFTDVNSLSASYISSMNHIGHEQRSQEFAARALSSYKSVIEGLFSSSSSLEVMDFNALLFSVRNVISATQVAENVKALDENHDKELLEIIRAADLLEVTSEHYLDWLIPLYIEYRIGGASWPTDLTQLLKGTYWFMRESALIHERLLSPLTAGNPRYPNFKQFLDLYPAYMRNLHANSENFKKFWEMYSHDLSLFTKDLAEHARTDSLPPSYFPNRHARQ